MALDLTSEPVFETSAPDPAADRPVLRGVGRGRGKRRGVARTARHAAVASLVARGWSIAAALQHLGYSSTYNISANPEFRQLVAEYTDKFIAELAANDPRTDPELHRLVVANTVAAELSLAARLEQHNLGIDPMSDKDLIKLARDGMDRVGVTKLKPAGDVEQANVTAGALAVALAALRSRPEGPGTPQSTILDITPTGRPQ